MVPYKVSIGLILIVRLVSAFGSTKATLSNQGPGYKGPGTIQDRAKLLGCLSSLGDRSAIGVLWDINQHNKSRAYNDAAHFHFIEVPNRERTVGDGAFYFLSREVIHSISSVALLSMDQDMLPAYHAKGVTGGYAKYVLALNWLLEMLKGTENQCFDPSRAYSSLLNVSSDLVGVDAKGSTDTREERFSIEALEPIPKSF
ncbi:hypothetical protein T459_15065 [Capsicum annuum]|uniref:Uncharacterized protein n=1 Tax=Capsicum annuum TaxID=4072 RepID=A0A2G2ZJ85_CAPAN|nr:hypothetical protein T459_15065 [Capsicum annuum]